MVKTLKMAIVVVSLLFLTGCFDNMYPTANFSPTCIDGQPGDLFCQTDNSNLTYSISGVFSSADRAHIETALGEFGATALNVSEESPAVTSGSFETDIMYQKSNTSVPGGSVGITWCDDAVGGTRQCDQHYVRWRLTEGSSTFQLYRSTACHETGHAVGLTHGLQASPTVTQDNGLLGCMITPSFGHDTLLRNNINQLNATY